MSRRAPLIGITSYPRGPARTGTREVFPMPTTYVEAVRAAGGVAVVLPPGEPDPPRLLDALDGIVLSGGGDVSPVHYGGEGHRTIYGTCDERDAFEIALARAAIERDDRPMFAICRGLQVLNVVLGGDLHAHLPDFADGTVEHRRPERTPTFHRARVEPGSRLAELLGASEVSVCSWHHQAVRRLAPSLRAVAWADDGVIEAVEHESHALSIAVQWHPEMQLDDPAQRRLFERFVALCAETRERRGG